MTGDQTVAFKSALDEAISSFGIESISEGQKTQLERHYSMLCRWNRRLNLTRILEPREAARLHYVECLFGARFITGERAVLDVGSGAGFPAIPLAVARPEVQVTALEANQKKSVFLKEAKDDLGLVNLVVVTARLEEFDWSGYYLLTSRALDRAEVVLPTVIEQLGQRQRLMLFSTRELVEKLERGTGGNPRVEAYAIPNSEERVLAIFTRK